MRVYIAGRFESRFELRGWRDELRSRGFSVRSEWLDHGPEVPSHTTDHAFNVQEARRDLRDVAACSVLLLDNRYDGGRGRWIEVGAALANERAVVSVGPDNSVFLSLCSVVPTFDDAVEVLNRFREPRR